MPRRSAIKRLSPGEAFKLLELAVIEGRRCPVSGTEGLNSQHTGELARSGHIRIDVYPHNWRVVTLLTGPLAGKATAGPPKPDWKPYLTIEKGCEANR